MREEHVDAVVIGAGVTGLFLTMKLARLGIKVVLLEQAGNIAPGPSTRNEGWLHNGTYHATSIADSNTAIQVARRCLLGHREIVAYAPEVVQDASMSVYALLKNYTRYDEILSRWNEAGVPYRNVPIQRLHAMEPSINLDNVSAVFEVQDKSINTRLLYQRLLADCRRFDAQILTGTRVQFREASLIELSAPSTTPRLVRSTVFAYAAGFGLESVLAAHPAKVNVPIRFWKSHLLIIPRAIDHAVFYLDPGEATMLHHGQYSIIGLNDDSLQVESPSDDVIPARALMVAEAINRLCPTAQIDDKLELACIKTDLDTGRLSQKPCPRSLNVAFHEPLENHFLLLPGKMTEAPFIANLVAQSIFSCLTTHHQHAVALRPLDRLRGQSKPDV